MVPGVGVGSVMIGSTTSPSELPFNLQDPYYEDGFLVGFSTNTGGSVAFNGVMVGAPFHKAAEAATDACYPDVPEAEIGDKYQKATAVWAWFMDCGLGIRVIVDDAGNAAVQAWAVFSPNDDRYRAYIKSTFVDKSGQRI